VLQDDDGDVRVRAFRDEHRVAAPDFTKHALQVAYVEHTLWHNVQLHALRRVERFASMVSCSGRRRNK